MLNLRIRYFRNEGEIRAFSDKQKLSLSPGDPQILKESPFRWKENHP